VAREAAATVAAVYDPASLAISTSSAVHKPPLQQ